MWILAGDSLTERGFDNGGWAAGLASQYFRKADIINRGFGGYNSRTALYLTSDLLQVSAGHLCSATCTLLLPLLCLSSLLAVFPHRAQPVRQLQSGLVATPAVPALPCSSACAASMPFVTLSALRVVTAQGSRPLQCRLSAVHSGRVG
jgi:hypothetical protein